MADKVDVYLKEYEQLRQELLGRINLAYALIALDLTVLGAGLTVFQTFPEVVVGLAVASSFLWLFFMDHASQVYKIAAYTALRLGPLLRATAPESLRWEEFLRDLDSGTESASRALFGSVGNDVRGWIVSGGSSSFLALLFGGSPVVLLIAFGASSGLNGTLSERLVRLGVLLVSSAVWVVALIRWIRFKRTVKAVNSAIRRSQDEH